MLSVKLDKIDGLTLRNTLPKPFYFQFSPLEEFGWDVTHGWQDYETISGGQFTREGGRELRTLSLNTMVLDYDPPWANPIITPAAPALRQAQGDGGPTIGNNSYSMRVDEDGEVVTPLSVAQELQRIVQRGTPIQLTIENPTLEMEPELDMAVTLRSLSIREKGGEPDARYFDMSFTEYRSPSIRRKGYGRARHKLPATVVVKESGICFEIIRQGKRIPEKNRHKIGTQAQPATLRKLSKHFYGNQKNWRKIAKANGVKNFGPDDGLDKLFERTRKKRKKQPLKLQIPEKK
jgi:hypothetical protein